MELLARLLTERPKEVFGVFPALLTGLLAALVVFGAAAARWRRPFPPQFALVLGFVTLATPLFLAPVLWAAAPEAIAADPDAVFQKLSLALLRAATAREAAGTALVLLALPIGAAVGLAGGMTSHFRAVRFGERARLAAQAAGDPETGQAIAASMVRRGVAWASLLGGALAGIFFLGVPGLALARSGRLLLQAVEDASGLDPAGASALLALAIATSRTALVEAAVVALVTGPIATLWLALGLHVPSSRRRLMARALAVLEERKAARPVLVAVGSALDATGRPTALGPAAVALLLLVLAGVAIAVAARDFTAPLLRLS